MRGHVVLCAMVLIDAAPCTLAQESPASQALMSNHGHDDRQLDVAALARLHICADMGQMRVVRRLLV